MDRETLLEKSRVDTKKGDEYQASIELKGYFYAMWSMRILCLIFWLLAEIGVIQGNIFVLTNTIPFQPFIFVFYILSDAVYHLYRFYYLRKKRNLYYGLFLAIGLMAFLYRAFIIGFPGFQ